MTVRTEWLPGRCSAILLALCVLIPRPGVAQSLERATEVELRRTGDYAVPFMVDALRKSASPELTRGLIGALPKMEAATPG